MLFSFLLLFWNVAQADYVLLDDYKPESFTDMFDFYSGFNPGHGFANYVNRTVAEAEGLYKGKCSTFWGESDNYWVNFLFSVQFNVFVQFWK